MLNSALYQALHVLSLQLVKHWICRSIVIDHLQQRSWILGTDCLSIRIDTWRDPQGRLRRRRPIFAILKRL